MKKRENRLYGQRKHKFGIELSEEQLYNKAKEAENFGKNYEINAQGISDWGRAANSYSQAAEYRMQISEPLKAAQDYRKAAHAERESAKAFIEESKLPEYSEHPYRERVYKDSQKSIRKAETMERKATRLEKIARGEWRGLGTKKTIIAALMILIGIIFFLSSNMTGNSIINISQTTTKGIGIVFFIIGITVVLIFFREKTINS